jgi:hypothetical protein
LQAFGDYQVRHFNHHTTELPGDIEYVNPNHHTEQKYRCQGESSCQLNNAGTRLNFPRLPHLPS